MMKMSGEILSLVESYDHVSFAEFDQKITGFKGGDKMILVESEKACNIVLWFGLTDQAVDAMEELRVNKKIHAVPASFLVYAADGVMPRLPLAKSARKYKEPHWLPVVFRAGADPRVEKKKRRSS
jgi:hypothetical protein